MSYFDDASLVMIPSGYKEDKVYSVKPIDGSGDLDFTRASSATRIGPTGLIEKTRTNNLLQSNQLDTTWATANSATITGGQSGYDGTNNAWLLTKGSSGFSHLQQDISLSGVTTFSVYVKGTSTGFSLRENTSGKAEFDLSNGTIVANNADTIGANIESIGGGWYRASVNFNKAISRLQIYPKWDSSDIESVIIQNAQAEQGLVATSYIDTTTTAVSVGSYDNVPRLNYTAGSTSSCPSLLLEPQRTNIILNSEYFDSGYIYSNITQSLNTSISSPSNENAVYEFNDGTATSLHTAYVTSAQATSADSIFSLFAKQGTSKYIRLGCLSSGSERAVFDLNAGTVHAAPTAPAIDIYGIENYGNGWYRCYIKLESGERAFIQSVDTDGTTFNYTGSNQTFYVFGAQVEAGSYATSYIPTNGATVTRVVDDCNKTGISSILNILKGTLVMDLNIDSSVNTEIYLARLEGVNFNDTIYIYKGTNKKVKAVYRIGGVTYQSSDILTEGRFKLAFSYDSTTNGTFFVNGTKVGSDFSLGSPTVSLGTLRLGGFNATLAKQSGETKSLLYFDTKLTDTQLAELTSLDS